jgi:molecular chaperone GrpE (heat shock protein)
LEAQLEAQLALRNQEIQFLTKKITRYERALEDSKNLFDHKVKAIEREFNDSYQDYRKSLDQKYNRILSGLSQLLPLVETLERSSLHGRHFVSSETNMGILMKLKLVAKELNQEINNDNVVEQSPPMVSLNCDLIHFYPET